MLLRLGHGRAVDWWSLGALLYEMITGLPPFYSRNRETMFEKIMTAELNFPPFMSEVRYGYSDKWWVYRYRITLCCVIFSITTLALYLVMFHNSYSWVSIPFFSPYPSTLFPPSPVFPYFTTSLIISYLRNSILRHFQTISLCNFLFTYTDSFFFCFFHLIPPLFLIRIRYLGCEESVAQIANKRTSG